MYLSPFIILCVLFAFICIVAFISWRHKKVIKRIKRNCKDKIIKAQIAAKAAESDKSIQEYSISVYKIHAEAWFRHLELQCREDLKARQKQSQFVSIHQWDDEDSLSGPELAVHYHSEMLHKLASAASNDSQIQIVQEYVPMIIENLVIFQGRYVDLLDGKPAYYDFRALLDFYNIK